MTWHRTNLTPFSIGGCLALGLTTRTRQRRLAVAPRKGS